MKEKQQSRDMNRTLIKLRSVSEIVGNEDVALLTFVDEHEERQLSVMCDEDMKNQLVIRTGIEGVKNRPILSKRLPEVFSKILDMETMHVFYEVYVYDLVNGEYLTVVFNLINKEKYHIRLSDAVLLSVVCDVPVYISTPLFERQSTPFSQDSHHTNIPINSLDLVRLEQELGKALEREDYRTASFIQKEISRRKSEDNPGIA